MKNRNGTPSYIPGVLISAIVVVGMLLINQARAWQNPTAGARQDLTATALPTEQMLSVYPDPGGDDDTGVRHGVWEGYAPPILGIVVEAKSGIIVQIEPGSPAEQAGLQLNDRFVAWNNILLADYYATEEELLKFKWFIAESEKENSKIRIERDGTSLELAIELLPKGVWYKVPPDNVEPRPTITPVYLPYWYF